MTNCQVTCFQAVHGHALNGLELMGTETIIVKTIGRINDFVSLIHLDWSRIIVNYPVTTVVIIFI